MKQTCLLPIQKCLALVAFAFLFATGTRLWADELALFDSSGTPVAYVADNLTIFLWSGEPVDYLFIESDTIHIYGFNGKHLGWVIDGIIIDHNGDAVGSVKGALQMIYQFEPFKSFKQFEPFKSFREFAPLMPFRSSRWSSVPLRIYLAAGAE